MAQEKERQKKVGLADSTNNRRERDKPTAMSNARKIEEVCLATGHAGKTVLERVKRGREWFPAVNGVSG